MNLAMVVAVAGPILRPMINDSQATRTTKGRRRWVRRRNAKVRMNVRYFYGVQPKQTKKCPNGIVISVGKGESAALPLNATSNHLQWTYHLISPLTKILTNNFWYYHTTLQVTNLSSQRSVSFLCSLPPVKCKTRYLKFEISRQSAQSLCFCFDSSFSVRKSAWCIVGIEGQVKVVH